MPQKTPVYGRLGATLGNLDLARVSYQHAHQNEGINPGLVLERYLPVPFDGHFPTGFTSETKGPWLTTFVRESNRAYQHQQAPWRRWIREQNQLFEQLPQCAVINLNPLWRWVIGMGNATILETGITLHRIYGIPYIPGSALKGLTQAWAETWCDPPVAVQQLRAIFGEQTHASTTNPQRAGEVVFLGAYPDPELSGPRLAVDIMTPHFPAYYQGTRANPLEIEDPIPIPFLVVQGGCYRAFFAARTPRTSQAVVKEAAKLCLEALDELGVGGKTAKGYGYFSAQ